MACLKFVGRIKLKKNLLLILVCIIIISIPIYRAEIAGGDPILFNVARIKSIAEGYFWIYPTWLFDFGEPVGIFYPWLFLCIPALMLKIGLPIEFVINSFSFLIIVATAVSSYIAGKIMFKSNRLSTIFSISYLLQWFIQADIFLLTDFSSALANIFLPLAFSSTVCLLKSYKGNKNLWIVASFAYTGLIQSDLLTFFIFLCCMLILCIMQMIRRKSIDVVDLGQLSRLILSVLGLNMFFILPFIMFSSHIEVNHHLIDTLDIIFIIFTIKKAYYLMIPLFILTGYNIFKGRLSKLRRLIFYFGFIVAVISVFIASDVFPWYLFENTIVANFIEHTWNFMSILSLGFALSMTIVLANVKRYLPQLLIILSLYSITFGANIWIGTPDFNLFLI